MNENFDINKCKSGTSSIFGDPLQGTKNIIVIIYILNNQEYSECYTVSDLWNSIKGSRKIWQKVNQEKMPVTGWADKKEPVLKLPWSNRYINYSTMSLILQCHSNTILLNSKPDKNKIYGSGSFLGGLHGQLNENIFSGIPIRRSTFLKGNIKNMLKDSANFLNGSLKLTNSDFLDESEFDDLPQIENRNELTDDDENDAIPDDDAGNLFEKFSYRN